MTIKEFEKSTGIRLNMNMSGKMEGINCLSTSCLCNDYCAARRNIKGSICERCFAASTISRYSALNQNMKHNTKILSEKLFDIDEFPLINSAIFRFESFGDLNNSIQCANYFRFAKKNPYVRFALWTKNPTFVQECIEKLESKPENLIIIISSIMINEKLDISRWGFADKVFTVYDKTYIKENNIKINCGARNCLACQRCYRKDTEKEISEILK